MNPYRDAGLVLLMPEEFGRELAALAQSLGFGAVRCVNTRAALAEAVAAVDPRVLLAFSTGVLVPHEILQRPGLVAANVHGASPAYPGRDPHHFAVYEQAQAYGATLHYMVRAVDQGPIVGVSLQPVSPTATPAELMAVGVRHGLALARGFLQQLAESGPPPADPALRWTGPVRRRSDFLALCEIDAGISPEEFERRLRATAMPGHANLRLTLHGRSFRLEADD